MSDPSRAHTTKVDADGCMKLMSPAIEDLKLHKREGRRRGRDGWSTFHCRNINQRMGLPEGSSWLDT